jgi:hypothetical protein
MFHMWNDWREVFSQRWTFGSGRLLSWSSYWLSEVRKLILGHAPVYVTAESRMDKGGLLFRVMAYRNALSVRAFPSPLLRFHRQLGSLDISFPSFRNSA